MITEWKIDTARRAVQWLYYWTMFINAGVEDVIWCENKADRAIAQLCKGKGNMSSFIPSPFCDFCGKTLRSRHLVNQDYHFCSEQCRDDYAEEFGDKI